MAYDEDLADRIREVMAADNAHTEMKMFGGLAFLIGGNMAVAASSSGGLLLRVGADRSDELAARPHAEPFDMRGRGMKGWLHIADDGLTDDAELRSWVQIGVDVARSLPPK